MVILRVAGTNLAVPVEREADFVELLTIAVDVGYGSYLWVLTSLDSILLSRQSVRIVTHRVQYVKSVQTLVACIDIASDITKWVTYEKLRTWRKFVFFGIFVFAAILTPPDIVSQIMVAIPIVALYEFSILLSRLVYKAKRKKEAEA